MSGKSFRGCSGGGGFRGVRSQTGVYDSIYLARLVRSDLFVRAAPET